MAQKISMQQLADRLGVSKYTVSQALSGKPGVSEATRREVTALAAALGYGLKTSPADARLSPNDTKKLYIGLDERHVKEPNFWQRVIEGLEAGCRLHGLAPHFFAFGQHAYSAADFPAQLGIEDAAADGAGFLIAGSCPLSTLLQLKHFGLPMVLADHEEPLTGADAVLNANTEAGRMACRHLLSKGCRSLVFAGRDSFAVSFRERWWGCRQAMEEAKEPRRSQTSADTGAMPTFVYAGRGAAGDPRALQLKKWTLPYGNMPVRTWQPALERRIEAASAEGSLPDGIICANDDIALHALQVLAARGLHPGIRVVGIDNTAPGMEASVPLTTVDLAKEWLGIRAVEAFIRRARQPEAQPEKIILSARLLVRKSG
ncbi:LacI family DNA-binding transcriptional regulator [Paenibacillus sp. R14(2021)]|uniref:LacI family DNA-binding transcriptional regulator n=1 Tax=Paenibacillus sp. R14(2021) TaxID=2859228 RepID=UPI001C61259C|nr:LacI family DNA-binding transcriptional regulator [Paenibacillus sp. R14(2021)]